MRVAHIAAACLALALASPAAEACGACIEDKVAATYDYAVLERAHQAHRIVVFAEIRGNADAAHLERAAAAGARRVRGIDPSSVRSAHAPLALSFALDPAIPPESALAAVAKSAAMPGIELAVVRVLR